MSSINLLPKNLVIKENSAKRKRDVFVISFLMLFVSAIMYTSIYIEKVMAEKNLGATNLILDSLDKEIKAELDENKFPIQEDKMQDAMDLLNSHSYYSKVLEKVQELVNEDVYLSSGSFSVDDESSNVIFSFDGFAQNYKSAMEQIAVLKNSFWVDKVEIYNFSFTEGTGIGFDGEVVFNEKLLKYNEKYWEFGLNALEEKTDRFLRIDNYSADLVDLDDNYIINITFDGMAYEEGKLISLESELSSLGDFISEVVVDYDLMKELKDDAIEFKGSFKMIF